MKREGGRNRKGGREEIVGLVTGRTFKLQLQYHINIGKVPEHLGHSRKRN